jgi:uncharacterized protein (DUF4415 family)
MSSKLSEQSRQELAILAARPDDIDLSDIPETQVSDWHGATRGKFYRPIKQQVTVRIDADVIDWLKQQGQGYQTRLNSILRQAMQESVKPH